MPLMAVPAPTPVTRVRVGTDLAHADDVATSIGTFGERYLARVYTGGELAQCSDANGPNAERLAARFAAKESVVKALRPTEGVAFGDIEVHADAWGAPSIRLHGAMAVHANSIGLADSSLSLTHHDGLACAVFVAVLQA